MHNARFRFALFNFGKRSHYSVLSKLPRSQADMNSQPISVAPRRTYRGPDLGVLFPEEDMTGLGIGRVLLLLDVPGLPEVLLPDPRRRGSPPASFCPGASSPLKLGYIILRRTGRRSSLGTLCLFALQRLIK